MGIKFSKRARHKKKRAKDVIVPISVRSTILNDLNDLEAHLVELRDDIESIKIQTDEKNNHIEET
jgi:hypothetical protein